MRVVHVCFSDIGGGGVRAAYRVHRALCKSASINSKMLVPNRYSDDDTVIAHNMAVSKPKNIVNRVFDKIYRRLGTTRDPWVDFITPNNVIHSRADVKTEMLSSLSRIPHDVVNLHWLGSNTLSIEEIGQIEKPVVWTFHDMWAFCGAEHYAPDGPDARFRIGYHEDNRTEGEAGPDLNRWVWERKRKAWKQSMTIVCLSRWLEQCTRESVLFKRASVQRIPYALDIDRWQPFPKEYARKLLSLPQDKRIVMFGAIGGEVDVRKGADLLREALQILKGRGVESLILVVFGQSAPKNSIPFAYPITYLGRLHDDYSLVATYSSADVMIVPSRQDNLPLTAVEAQSCGVPVVAFNIGGLPDIVGHQVTGYLARPFEISDLAKGINWVLRDEQHRLALGEAARESVVRKYAESVVAKAYRELYEQVLAEHSRS